MISPKTHQNILIRPMQFEDVVDAVKIISHHDKFDGKCSKLYYNAYFSNENRTKSELECNFVAVDISLNKVIGVCGFTPDKYSTPHILWLTWFYLNKKYHGMGIGKELLDHTINLIRNMKINKVFLDTSSHPKYEKSIKTYSKFGFEIEGTLLNYYGKGESLVIMGLELK